MARESLIDFLREYGARGPGIAVAHRRGYRFERWSYADVCAAASRFARELEFRGIAKGDSAILWGPACGEWVAAFFGCALRGVIAVPLDPASTHEFAGRVAAEVRARLLIRSREISSPPAGASPGPAGLDSLPQIVLEEFPSAVSRHSAGPYPSPALTRDDPLEIIFTSGTTAEPRGVVISHGNVLANIEPLEPEIAKYRRAERLFHPIRFLNLLPLSHVFGQIMGLFIPPLLGGTVFFLDSLKPPEIIETIRRERISVLVAVPRVIESLERQIERDLEAEGRLAKFQRTFAAAEHRHFLRRWWDFRRVHRRFGWKFWAFISGGAALPQSVEGFWHRLGYAVVQGYGMTETTSLITLNHPLKTGQGSIGKAFPGMEIKVADDGEILVRGPSVARAYRRGSRLEPVAAEEGWLHTGDLAEIGQDGRLYFKGRRKNVIVTPAGMNIYPEDLESALRAQPGVRDCVVTGLARDGNEEPCAALLLDAGADAAARAVEAANRSLAEYQRIRAWFVWPDADFPRTPAQKPVLARIREAAAQRFAGEAAPVAQPAPWDTGSVASLVARITGQSPHSLSPETNLETDLNLSSLDRVELLSALEDRYQVDLSQARFAQASTIGQLEDLIRPPAVVPPAGQPSQVTTLPGRIPASPGQAPALPHAIAPARPSLAAHVFPRWPQWPIVTLARLAVYYALTWPATRLMAAPRVEGRANLRAVSGPVLVVSNHVAYLDVGFVLAALPARFRHRLATAMGGERLAGMRMGGAVSGARTSPRILPWHVRLLNRVSYFLVVALFNVFPLPQESGFLRSFSLAGDLADRGWSVLIFPEGATTPDGQIKPFRSGIGLLATRLNIPVVPIRLAGLYELRETGRRMHARGAGRLFLWRLSLLVRRSPVHVTIGAPVRYRPNQDPEEIARDLQRIVAEL